MKEKEEKRDKNETEQNETEQKLSTLNSQFSTPKSDELRTENETEQNETEQNETEQQLSTLNSQFSTLRDLLYRQKPESREAEIRAERNRAKATAFLQAFGTISDAFTLSRGGDVAKRDMNPYILNHQQKATALGEQDRADKKAWENSLLNLENNVAQYNIRQQELAKQKEWEKEKTEQAQDFQRQMWGAANDEYDRRASQDFQYDQLGKDNEHKRRKELYGINNKARLEREQLIQEGRKYIAAIKATRKSTGGSSNPSSKPYLTIDDPNNPNEKIGIDEGDALKLFSYIMRDIGEYEDEMENIIPFRRNGNYSREEAKRAVVFFAAQYPNITLEYFGEIEQAGTNGTVGTNGTGTAPATQTAPAATAAPTQPQQTPQQPQQASPYPQGQGPVAGYYQQQTQPAQPTAPATAASNTRANNDPNSW